MASISLNNVKKVYNGKEKVTAVQYFNLEIKDQEFVVLVGPSGCGKSTILRMIAGLEDITQGDIYIDGKRINEVSPKDRDIAMVFQNYSLYPHMTVFENMAFGLALRKLPKKKIRQRVYEAAKILDIEYLLARKPKALSGGQRQRVALGRAIVRKPKVFLLDEPLSNLDIKLRTQMRSEIARLHKKLGTTFVYVTHDQTEATSMGDRIVVMNDGRIQQVDTPVNLYQYPQNSFVAGFIGVSSMNIYIGKLIYEDDRFIVVFNQNKLYLPKSKNKDNKLLDYVNKNVKFGIRPEDIYFTNNLEDNAYAAIMDLKEMMGAEILVNFCFENIKTIAKFKSNTMVRPGNEFFFRLDADKVHLFNHDTGQIIVN